MVKAPRPCKVLLFLTAFFVLFAPLASAARKSVVLLPLVFHADSSKTYLQKGLKSMFMTRLAGEDLEVLSEEALAPLLDDKDKQGIASEERAAELAERLKADYAIFGSVTAVGTGYSLDLSILDRTKEKPEITTISEAGNEDLLIPKVAEIVYDFRAIVAGVDIRAQKAGGPVKPDQDSSAMGLFFRVSPDQRGGSIKPTGRIGVRPAPVSMDAGDLNGDGEIELVVLSSQKMFVYTKNGDSYAQSATHEAPAGERFLKVSVGDLEGNGKAKIYLVSLNGLRARTTVWEWAGKLRKTDDLAGHLRVVGDPGGKRASLLFQDSKPSFFFNGKMYFMQYGRDGKLVKKEPLPDLKEAQFYTLSTIDLNQDTIPEFVGLGQAGQLHVWNRQGDVLWRDDNKIGGTNNTVRPGLDPTDTLVPLLNLDSRIVVGDIDKDGKKEIIVVHNTASFDFAENLRLFEKSSLLAYRAAGNGLSSAWKTPAINYCTMDIQVVNSTLFLAVQKGSRSMIDEGSGQIMWFK